MKTLYDFYAYSKDKSKNVLNLNKKVEIKKKNDENSWFKKVFSEFAKASKNSFEYLSEKKKQCKIKLSDLKFSYFNINNSKYENFPWYKKLYYLIRDKICNLLNIMDDQIEDRKIEENLNEKKISREYASEINFDIKSKEAQKNSKDSIFYKYSKNLKKAKSNSKLFCERSQSEMFKRNISGSVIPIRANGGTEDNNLLKVTSSARVGNEENFCDAKETKDIDNIITHNNDNHNFLNVANSPKFNIKDTWEKLSGLIS